MKLTDYCSQEKMNFSDVARKIGATPQAVRAWAIGSRIPSRAWMQKIVSLSNGAVQPNDFYDIQNLLSPGQTGDNNSVPAAANAGCSAHGVGRAGIKPIGAMSGQSQNTLFGSSEAAA